MKARYVPGDYVALDDFYKRPDGTVTVMSDEDSTSSARSDWGLVQPNHRVSLALRIYCLKVGT